MVGSIPAIAAIDPYQKGSRQFLTLDLQLFDLDNVFFSILISKEK